MTAYSNILVRLVIAGSILYIGYFIAGNISRAEMDGWSLGELLINYEGGFVRRGLLGQILLATGEPKHFALLLQKCVIMLFVVGSALLVFVWNTARASFFFALALCLSPGGLLDMASGGGFEYLSRKEIWMYVAIILITLLSVKWSFFSLKITCLVSAAGVLLVLNHELFAVFFAPVLILIHLINTSDKSNSRYLLRLAVISLPMASAAAFVILFPGDNDVAKAIYYSYYKTDASGVLGGIAAIGWSVSDSNALSARMLTEGSVYSWIFYLSISTLAGLALLMSATEDIENFVTGLLMLLWLLIAAVFSSFSGWDWGRWVSMVSVGFPLLATLHNVVLKEVSAHGLSSYLNKHGVESKIALSNWKKCVMGFSLCAFVIFLAVSTRMNHCCPQGSSINLQADRWLEKAFR